MKYTWIILFLFVATGHTLAQRPHLEIGALAGYTNEIHRSIETNSNVESLEVSWYQLQLLSRLSKLKFGIELNAGVEVGYNYNMDYLSKEYNGNTGLANARLSLLPYYYILKGSKAKWDVQLGGSNQFNLGQSNLPTSDPIRSYQFSAIGASNFTFKYYMVGVFVARNLGNSYSFKSRTNQFGGRFGIVF